jgi:hypothetical protein
VFEHGGGHSVGLQQAADDLPVATEAGDDDPYLLRLVDTRQIVQVNRHRTR